ncbi:MAG TPA: sulfite exporter TauE/SafE family protein [Glaciibacter sp.]|nr:sulfite exporter TauE/SafE family protein [Glaciibacter sp.]
MRDARGARYWVILAVIGLVGGALSGLFGIGGGIVMVPLLVSLGGFNQRQAAATSLVAIIPAAIIGSITYLVAGEIDIVAGAIISVGAVAGALVGSMLLRRLSLAWLSWMFIALLLVVAVRLLLVVPERGEALELSPGVALGYVALGLVMGVASGLFGIGGGVIAVPALVAIFGISDLIAKGTSLLVMIPTSIVGTISHVRARAVDVRAGLVVGVTATVASVPGALLALALPPRLSSILFAVLLLVVAAQLIVRAIRTRGR